MVRQGKVLIPQITMAARTTTHSGTNGARLIRHSSINRCPPASHQSLANLQCLVSRQHRVSHLLAQASPLSHNLLQTRCLWVSLVLGSLVWVSLNLTNRHPIQRCQHKT